MRSQPIAQRWINEWMHSSEANPAKTTTTYHFQKRGFERSAGWKAWSYSRSSPCFSASKKKTHIHTQHTYRQLTHSRARLTSFELRTRGSHTSVHTNVCVCERFDSAMAFYSLIAYEIWRAEVAHCAQRTHMQPAKLCIRAESRMCVYVVLRMCAALMGSATQHIQLWPSECVWLIRTIKQCMNVHRMPLLSLGHTCVYVFVCACNALQQSNSPAANPARQPRYDSLAIFVSRIECGMFRRKENKI